MRATELLAWRNQAGLTQPGLAALLSVHPMTISKWERGVVAIPPYLNLALETIRLNMQLTPYGTRQTPESVVASSESAQ